MGIVLRYGVVAGALLLCGCDYVRIGGAPFDPDHIYGNTPGEIANSLRAMQNGLDGDRQVRFHYAVETLKLVAPDKGHPEAVDGVTPRMAMMVRGQDVDRLMQIADTWRVSVPRQRPSGP